MQHFCIILEAKEIYFRIIDLEIGDWWYHQPPISKCQWKVCFNRRILLAGDWSELIKKNYYNRGKTISKFRTNKKVWGSNKLRGT